MPIDQQKLRSNYVFAGQGTAGELLAAMAPIGPLEEKLKKIPERVRWLWVGSVLIGFTLLGFDLFWAVIAILAAAAIFKVNLKWERGLGFIVHERVEFLPLLLNTLQQDSPSQALFDVQLQLRPNRRQISALPNPVAGGKQVLFQDDWLALSTRLSDGTSVSIKLTDFVRRRNQIGSSGKTKTRERCVTLARIVLTYNPALYGDASVAAQRLANPFRLPDGVQLKALKLEGKKISVKATVRSVMRSKPTEADLNVAAQSLLLGMYRILNLARTTAARTGGSR